MIMSRFVTKPFIFKVLTVVIGVVTLGLTAASYLPIYTEEPFLSVVSIAFILSFLYLVGVAFGIVPDKIFIKRLEIFYHGIIGLLLFMTGSVFLFSAIGMTCTGDCTGFHTKRYLASLFGLINAFMYALVAWNLLEVKIVSRNSVEGT